MEAARCGVRLLLDCAIGVAFLAIPLGFITVWVLRGLAKFHASLAAELLGRY